jgi:tRNA-specific 2-thiouridylase
MGRHEGIVNYTIGQRKGLGIGGGHSEDNSPFYVISIDPAANRVIVGPREALARDIIHIKGGNWLLPEGDRNRTDGIPVELKFRSMMKTIDAKLYLKGNEIAEIHLGAPQYGISPGQAAVCYRDDRMMGGGWITGTANSSMPLKAAA